MAENKDGGGQQEPQRSKENKDINENVEGRIKGSQNPAYENEESQSDISNVDQQEGSMNPGTLGGNLDSEKDDTA